MSHFTVMVKVTAERLEKHGGDINAAVGELMAPYQENNMGDCPEQYLAFNDAEEKYREDWETGTQTRVKLADGQIIDTGDDRCYRDPTPEEQEKIGLGSGVGGGVSWSSRDWKDGRGYRAKVYALPDGAAEVEVPHKEIYANFDEFIQQYAGYKRDEKTGKYGYWENPNAKWDYWRIGGRWRGLLRVKECAASAALNGEKPWELKEGFGRPEIPDQPHTADLARIEDIDFEGMALEVDSKIEEFWKECERLKEVGLFDPNIPDEQKNEARKKLSSDEGWLDYHTHGTLYDLGLRRRNSRDEPFELIDFTLEDLKTKYRHHWEFSTYAVVDDAGWHAKGRMGWFGSSSETVEEAKEFEQSFADRFLKSERPDTVVVICDCHI